MNLLIYLVIILLFVVLVFWSWNNTKEYKNVKERVKFITIGIVGLIIVTTIIFYISKIGIKYPNKEIENQVRKIVILIFVPINGFLSLPHIASIKAKMQEKMVEEEKIKKRIILLVIIFIVSIVIEINYIKGFQSGIIQMLNNK